MTSQVLCESEKNKRYSFKVGNCTLSSQLHPEKQDSVVFISHHLLEKLISQQLKNAGIDPMKGEKFVSIDGSNIQIVGKYEFINININMDFRFYQKKKQKKADEMYFDFKVSFDRPNQNFLDNLLDLVTLPVGIVYQSIFTVVFAATKVSVDEMSDYFTIESKGQFDPFTLFKKIGSAFLNILLPRDMEINVEHVGTVTLKLGPNLEKLFSKIEHLEIGSGSGKHSKYIKVIAY
ncbi:hypothetical protein MJH12_08405 [bacterium]|nr:hypothetical protein [bacterium]